MLKLREEEGEEEGNDHISGEVNLATVRKLELLPSPSDKAEKKAFTLYLEGRSITLKVQCWGWSVLLRVGTRPDFLLCIACLLICDGLG